MKFFFNLLKIKIYAFFLYMIHKLWHKMVLKVSSLSKKIFFGQEGKNMIFVTYFTYFVEKKCKLQKNYHIIFHNYFYSIIWFSMDYCVCQKQFFSYFVLRQQQKIEQRLTCYIWEVGYQFRDSRHFGFFLGSLQKF